MKIIFLLATLFLFVTASAIIAQDDTEKPTTQVEAKEDKPQVAEGKTHQFGLTIKRMDYTYIPAEYHLSKNPSFYDPYHTIGNLKKNQQVTLPFALSYFNKNWNLFIEASHYKVTYNDMYARRYAYDRDWYNTQPVAYRFSAYDTEFPSKTRRESKINFYKQAQLNESNSFFYGIGIRNIYKESYVKRTFIYDYSEYRNSINAYGLQLFFKYQLQLSSSLKLNLTAEPFLTSGRRNLQEGLNPYTYYSLIYQGFNGNYFFNGQVNSIYGVETDLQFAYSLNENLNLLVGYNYIYTKIRTGDINSFFSKYPVIETKDNIYGYYIGLNAKF